MKTAAILCAALVVILALLGGCTVGHGIVFDDDGTGGARLVAVTRALVGVGEVGSTSGAESSSGTGGATPASSGASGAGGGDVDAGSDAAAEVCGGDICESGPARSPTCPCASGDSSCACVALICANAPECCALVFLGDGGWGPGGQGEWSAGCVAKVPDYCGLCADAG